MECELEISSLNQYLQGIEMEHEIISLKDACKFQRPIHIRSCFVLCAVQMLGVWANLQQHSKAFLLFLQQGNKKASWDFESCDPLHHSMG